MTSADSFALAAGYSTASRSEIVFKQLPTDDPKQRQPDIALAREKLGWQASTSLQDGLEKTIGYFAERIESLKQAPNAID
jgi:UDP-glucuronate decarboxylase